MTELVEQPVRTETKSTMKKTASSWRQVTVQCFRVGLIFRWGIHILRVDLRGGSRSVFMSVRGESLPQSAAGIIIIIIIIIFSNIRFV
jgi:hypothetical protein